MPEFYTRTPNNLGIKGLLLGKTHKKGEGRSFKDSLFD